MEKPQPEKPWSEDKPWGCICCAFVLALGWIYAVADLLVWSP